MQFKSLLYGPLLIILPSLIGCGQAKTENRRTPPQSEIQEENPIQEQEPDESAPGEQEPEGERLCENVKLQNQQYNTQNKLIEIYRNERKDIQTNLQIKSTKKIELLA